jgi:CheY-like chemotaxis protein
MIKTSKSKKIKSPEALRIVVVAPDLVVTDPEDDHALSQAKRSRALRIGLLENGFNLIASLPADVFLADRIAQLQPDLIIVDAESEARDALEHVVFATRDARRPIVMFTDDSDTSHVKDAVAVGVSATSWTASTVPASNPFWKWRWLALNMKSACAANETRPEAICKTEPSSIAPRLC